MKDHGSLHKRKGAKIEPWELNGSWRVFGYCFFPGRRGHVNKDDEMWEGLSVNCLKKVGKEAGAVSQKGFKLSVAWLDLCLEKTFLAASVDIGL